MPLSVIQHDANLTAIETEVALKQDAATPPACFEVVKTASYTLSAADHGRSIVCKSACATITHPALGVPVRIEIVNATAGVVTINGIGAVNAVLEIGDVATVIERGDGVQQVAYGPTTVTS